MVCEGYFNSMLPSERKWRLKYGEYAFQNILDHIASIYDVGGLPNQNYQTHMVNRGGVGRLNVRVERWT